MKRAEDEEQEAMDRAAILARRARVVVGAVGGLLLPIAAGCTPCLSIVPPTTTAQPSSVETTSTGSPSSTPSGSASPSARAPLPPGWFAISVAEAEKQGLPAIGFRTAMTLGGWSVHEPRKDIYVSASGPPGGPLSVRASAFRDAGAQPTSLEALFKQAVADHSGLDPIVVGAAETLTLGGRQLAAQSFRTGQSLGTTNWCAVKAPAADGKSGVLFLFGTSGREKDKPTCASSLAHEAIGEIVKSLAFEP